MASEHWVIKGGKEFSGGNKADVYKRRFYFGSWLGIQKPTPTNHRRADKAVLIFAATFEEHRAAGADGWTTEAEQAARLAAMRAFGQGLQQCQHEEAIEGAAESAPST